MLDINFSDVLNVIESIKGYLIAMAVILVLAIVITIAVHKLPKETKGVIRGESWLAAILALVVVVNLICTGPMSTMLDLVSGTGSISAESSATAEKLCTTIAEEGIVLLKNEDNALPLGSNTKLNVFGWASSNPCYGGTGSGALNDLYHIVTLTEGLANAGIEVNTELTDFYTNYRDSRLPPTATWDPDWTLPEPNVNLYNAELLNNAKNFSDVAMVVIARVGGEGFDLPTDMAAVVNGTYDNSDTDTLYDDTLNEGEDWNEGDTYLNLSNRERELIEMVCDNFDTVFVVYNGANAFELGFVDEYPQIKGALWCAGMGQTGFNALGEILAGTVNPSGRTVDTYVYDLTATPYFNNYGLNVYSNMKDQAWLDEWMQRYDYPSFVNYVEGIYEGYRFYETAATEGLFNYYDVVQYPFGYGLSYTTFSQYMSDITVNGGNIEFSVTVTNTGSVAGKDVVEVYYNPPYTNGGIEKATANLIAFGKTTLLGAGDSDTIKISFPIEEMASYDDQGAGCYVLEQGEYIISINSDSHNVIDSRVYTQTNTITYDTNNKRESDALAATNQFDYAAGHVTYLSRTDGFANYDEATAAPTDFVMPDDQMAQFFNNNNYDPTTEDDPNAVAPAMGQNNGLQLVDLRGVAYDDPKWDQLLDEMTADDMNALISLGGYQTNGVDSIGKVRTNDCDGPASINNNFTGTGSIGFPSAVVIAGTWNVDLGYAFGDSIGEMANEMDVSGWYAPAMNIHRSAFAGRNFEYYSEDGFLSGKIAAAAIQAAKTHGVYAYAKHFALNDQETNRWGMLCTWTTEQAMREIYLKPFEIAVKEGGTQAIMSSYNYIGPRWAGGSSALLNAVLRDEWGFQGFVLTDYFRVFGYMNADQAIRNGTDCMLINYPIVTNDVTERSASGLNAMRQASKNILFTVVNSRAYADENLNPGMPRWQVALIIVDVIAAAIFVCCEVILIRKYFKTKKA